MLKVHCESSNLDGLCKEIRKNVYLLKGSAGFFKLSA